MTIMLDRRLFALTCSIAAFMAIDQNSTPDEALIGYLLCLTGLRLARQANDSSRANKFFWQALLIATTYGLR
jgi:hypothetical protein